jgi:hydrogenase (NiFe) small subunit (hydA)
MDKIKLVWLETDGCSGNIISFLDSNEPGAGQVLKGLIDLRYNNSIMAEYGENAMRQLFKTMEEEFYLVVEGAIPVKDNGIYAILGRYQGKAYTALNLVKTLGSKAKHVIAVGTCASYGGPSAASPNPTECRSVSDVLSREVIKLPLCPINPHILISIIYNLAVFGVPELDTENRPIEMYGITIHDRCPRRSFFDRGIFARNLGEMTCMFKLGCSGPVTKIDCPIRRWNSTDNWPIGANTPCIGCANRGFPDGREPFIECMGDDRGEKNE